MKRVGGLEKGPRRSALGKVPCVLARSWDFGSCAQAGARGVQKIFGACKERAGKSAAGWRGARLGCTERRRSYKVERGGSKAGPAARG